MAIGFGILIICFIVFVTSVTIVCVKTLVQKSWFEVSCAGDIGSSWKVYCEPFVRFIEFVLPVFHQVFVFPVAIVIHIHPEPTNPVLQAEPLLQITCPIHPHIDPVLELGFVIQIQPEFTNPSSQVDPLLQITCPVHPQETQVHHKLLNHALQLLMQIPHWFTNPVLQAEPLPQITWPAHPHIDPVKLSVTNTEKGHDRLIALFPILINSKDHIMFPVLEYVCIVGDIGAKVFVLSHHSTLVVWKPGGVVNSSVVKRFTTPLFGVNVRLMVLQDPVFRIQLVLHPVWLSQVSLIHHCIIPSPQYSMLKLHENEDGPHHVHKQDHVRPVDVWLRLANKPELQSDQVLGSELTHE